MRRIAPVSWSTLDPGADFACGSEVTVPVATAEVKTASPAFRVRNPGLPAIRTVASTEWFAITPHARGCVAGGTQAGLEAGAGADCECDARPVES